MEAVESANPVIGKITCGSLLQQLQKIWDEVGEADEERDKMILQLEQECLDVYTRRVDKAVKSREQLLQTLADARVELANLLLALGEKTYVGIPENTSGTIKEQLAAIAPALEKLWKQKDDRIKEFSDVQSQIHKIRAEIDGTSEQVESPVVDESDLSTKKLDKFHAQLENLQKEKNERLHKVLEFVSSARDLCAVLGTDFCTTVTEVHPSLNDNRGVQLISISNDTLSRLDKAVSALQEDKKTRLQKIQELATRLIDLWNLTDTPAENRSLFDLVTCNLSASVDEVIVPGALAKDLIQHAKVEVERLSQLKAGRTKELAAKRQAELRKMFADARIEIDTKPAREKIPSPIGAGNVEPAKLTADIDDQIVKENGEFSNGKGILGNVEKLMSACKEEICEDDYNMTDTPNKCNSVPDDELVTDDYSNEFKKNDKFDTREDLITWVRQVSKQHGMVLTTKASNNGNGRRRRPYVILVCERGGNYYPKFGVGGKRKRASSSKKCGCPFELKGMKLGKDDDQVGWELTVVCGTHNHSNSEKMQRSSYAGRLSAEEIILVEDMLKRSVKPRDILAALKERDETKETTLKTVYNACQTIRFKEHADRWQLKLLMGKLTESSYIVRHRLCETTNEVTDMLWMHPTSVSLMGNFPNVLVMDCTRRTNFCRFPLLEIAGITSTNTTFTIAFAYLRSDKAENYEWALDNFRIVMEWCPMPSVIVTDRDLELMKAVEVRYPNSRHMLCRSRIRNDVMASCKKLFEDESKWAQFELEWGFLVEQETEEMFNIKLSSIKNLFSDYPVVLSYIQETWLDPYKDRFVSAWTDTCKHLGVYATSNMLKRCQLESSQGTFSANWAEINKLLLLQHTEIDASFQKSRNDYQHDDFTTSLFKELCGFVSLFALEKISAESKRANNVSIHPCKCSVRATHGLPCAHEMQDFQTKGTPIPLLSIDPHWRILSIESRSTTSPTNDSGEDDTDDSYTECMQELRKILNGPDEERRRDVIAKMRNLVGSDRFMESSSQNSCD